MRKYSFLLLLLSVLLVSACSSSDDISPSGGTSFTGQTVDTTMLTDNYTYELPVIFHVLYNDKNDDNQYIPYQRLSNLIQYVNEIYQGGIYGESENVHVKFVLATKDENGKKLDYPGVDYAKYTGEYPIDVEKFMTDKTGNNVKYIWEPNDYINVMMFNFKASSNESITLGISHMPNSIKGDHELAGLETLSTPNVTKADLPFAYCSAINSLYANRSSEGGYYQSDRYTNANHQMTTYTSADIVMTLAHELGHYLGLYHVFTEATNGSDDNSSVDPVDSCSDTDYCTDTYSYNRAEYNEYMKYEMSKAQGFDYNLFSELLLRSSCDSVKYNADNIMDYSICLGFKITPEQKARIRHVLYYSPLIPGPKKYRTTRAATVAGPVDIKIKTIK
jgi:zinc-dependent metalloproteinase lipoprotein